MPYTFATMMPLKNLYSFHLIYMNVHSVLARATYRQAYLSFFCHQKMPNERECDTLRSVICIIPFKVHTDINIPESSSAVLAFTSGTTCPFTKALTCLVLSKSPMHHELNGKSQSPSLSSSLHLVLRLVSSEQMRQMTIWTW